MLVVVFENLMSAVFGDPVDSTNDGAMRSSQSVIIWRTAVFWASLKADQPDASPNTAAKALLVVKP
jgi:hypothetical protein